HSGNFGCGLRWSRRDGQVVQGQGRGHRRWGWLGSRRVIIGDDVPLVQPRLEGLLGLEKPRLGGLFCKSALDFWGIRGAVAISHARRSCRVEGMLGILPLIIDG